MNGKGRKTRAMLACKCFNVFLLPSSPELRAGLNHTALIPIQQLKGKKLRIAGNPNRETKQLDEPRRGRRIKLVLSEPSLFEGEKLKVELESTSFGMIFK